MVKLIPQDLGFIIIINNTPIYAKTTTTKTTTKKQDPSNIFDEFLLLNMA